MTKTKHIAAVDCQCLSWARAYGGYILSHHRNCEHYNATLEIEAAEDHFQVLLNAKQARIDELEATTGKMYNEITFLERILDTRITPAGGVSLTYMDGMQIKGVQGETFHDAICKALEIYGEN